MYVCGGFRVSRSFTVVAFRRWILFFSCSVFVFTRCFRFLDLRLFLVVRFFVLSGRVRFFFDSGCLVFRVRLGEFVRFSLLGI